MTGNPRIDELRRRVDKDPSSIAFAQLAEEYRRNGDLLEAVNVCRDGLARHPGYVSAHVTLGRALIELGQHKEARAELQAALRAAPDNLAAIRAMADLHHQYEEPLPDISPVMVEEAPVAVPEPVFAEESVPARVHDVPARADDDPALHELEEWLAAIVADRAQVR